MVDRYSEEKATNLNGLPNHYLKNPILRNFFFAQTVSFLPKAAIAMLPVITCNLMVGWLTKTDRTFAQNNQKILLPLGLADQELLDL